MADAPRDPTAPDRGPAPAAPAADPLPAVPHLEAKALALVLLLALLLAGAVGYLLYARGAFEPTQRLVLLADDSEGVVVGMDLSFAGFPIGRVRRIALGPDGSARILIDVPKKDAHWLRSSSVFTLVRGVVGNTALRAYSGQLQDPPLPDGAERRVLAGDASAEIPRLLGAARELAQNLAALTAPDAALAATLAQLRQAAGRLNGPRGAAGLALGEADAARLSQALARTDALLARLDRLAGQADAQVFGTGGLLPEAQAGAAQLRALLAEARGTLAGVDRVLVDAQAVAANTRAATVDLDALRAEVEASLRRLQALVDELNRRWPFARDTELRLP